MRNFLLTALVAVFLMGGAVSAASADNDSPFADLVGFYVDPTRGVWQKDDCPDDSTEDRAEFLQNRKQVEGGWTDMSFCFYVHISGEFGLSIGNMPAAYPWGDGVREFLEFTAGRSGYGNFTIRPAIPGSGEDWVMLANGQFARIGVFQIDWSSKSWDYYTAVFRAEISGYADDAWIAVLSLTGEPVSPEYVLDLLEEVVENNTHFMPGPVASAD